MKNDSFDKIGRPTGRKLNLSRIKAAARAKGYTVTSLAGECGLGREQMSRILNGRRGASGAVIKLLSLALELEEREVVRAEKAIKAS